MFLKKIKPLKKNTDHCQKEECDQQKKEKKPPPSIQSSSQHKQLRATQVPGIQSQ